MLGYKNFVIPGGPQVPMCYRGQICVSVTADVVDHNVYLHGDFVFLYGDYVLFEVFICQTAPTLAVDDGE